MKKIHRIVLVEDHRILREGLKALLSSNPGLKIVGEAENGLDAIRTVRKKKPGLVIMDLSMPKMDGLDAIKEIKRQWPEIKLLILTVHKAEEYVFAALKSGANGYLLKDSTYAELKLAIENVLDGKIYLSPGISETVVASYLRGKTPDGNNKLSMENLTQRERQILKLIAEGNTNKTIGEYLCISVKTVEKHRSNLMKKLDLHNASELTAFAMKKGLVTNCLHCQVYHETDRRNP